VRDLVEAGGVDVVAALFRDRIARAVYVQILKEEFARHGTRLVALNAQTDDSPEGELHGGILDQFAAYERAKIAERTRRGKLRKVREGKIVASGSRPNYGFTLNDTRDGYLINEPEAEVVRLIFRLMGEEKLGLYEATKALQESGMPAPGGGDRWFVTTLRKILFEDCYKRHTYSEMKELVSADVAARLDPDACCGVFYYGRRRHTNRPVAEQGEDGKRRYRRTQKIRYRPREEWIAVPVPDIGVPREYLEAARRDVANDRRPSGAGDRFWELSGGVLVCGGCGRRMGPDRRRNSSGSERVYFYYRCPKRRIEGTEACPNDRTQRAEKVEGGVWEVISGLLADPVRLRLGLERMIEQEWSTASRGPEREAALWAFPDWSSSSASGVPFRTWPPRALSPSTNSGPSWRPCKKTTHERRPSSRPPPIVRRGSRHSRPTRRAS
jgi:site-specific DNA recombinase